MVKFWVDFTGDKSSVGGDSVYLEPNGLGNFGVSALLTKSIPEPRYMRNENTMGVPNCGRAHRRGLCDIESIAVIPLSTINNRTGEPSLSCSISTGCLISLPFAAETSK